VITRPAIRRAAYSQQKERTMKRNHGLLGAAALLLAAVFLFAGCPTDSDDDDGGGSSSLTITGLSSLNGKYVYGQSASETLLLYAAQDINAANQTGNAALVANGQAVLKVYLFSQSGGMSEYSGSDANVQIYIAQQNAAAIDFTGSSQPETAGTVTVTFTNGVAAGALTAAN
jgi:hypothetical protein